MKIFLLLTLALWGCGHASADEVSSDLQRANTEKIARALKLQGVIEEGDSDELKPMLAQNSKEDLQRYASFCAKLNAQRKSYLDSHPSVAKSSYIQRIKEDDESELCLKTGRVLLKIACPPSLAQRLMPNLIEGYLSSVYSCKTFGKVIWERKTRLYGAISVTQFVSVSIEVAPSNVIAHLLANGKIDAFVGYGSIPASPSDGTVIGLDGLAIITNPQSQWSSTGLKASSELQLKTWLTVEQEPECRIPMWPKQAKVVSLSSFEEVEDRIFQDQEHKFVAVVPLGYASYTDNKVLRLETVSFPHGYRPTQLTVTRGLYPWTRTIFVKLGPAATEEAQSFSQFLDEPIARQLILRSGYAINEP